MTEAFGWLYTDRWGNEQFHRERKVKPHGWTETPLYATPPAVQSAITQCLRAIADLPTGRTEEVMEGHEDAYRAIEALSASGADTEAQIVAWLRNDADLTETESRKIVSNSVGLSPRDIADWQNLVTTKRGIADAIERGEHRERG